MGSKQYRRERFRKRLVNFLLFLVFFISAAAADEFSGQIILEKTSFLLNEEFRLSILIPEVSPSRLTVEEPLFPAGLSLLKGPFVRAGRNGSIIDYYFQALSQGRYIIDSFRIKSEGSVLLTTPVFVTAAPVFHIQGSFDKVPPQIKWKLVDRIYHPGEVIPLQFVIETLETADIAISSEVSQKPEGYVRKISRSGEKYEKTVFAKKVMTGEVYDIVFHDHVFVAFSAGNVVLPDVEISVSKGGASYRTTLKGIPLRIHNAPDSGSGTGAIGSFSLYYDISDKTISDNQPIIIRQKISGRGNFYGIRMPAPAVDKPGIAEITLLKDKYETVPDGKLFSGFRELTYSLRKIKKEETENTAAIAGSPLTEKIRLILPPFSWYEEHHAELPPGAGLMKQPGSTEEIIVLKTSEEGLLSPDERIAKTGRATLFVKFLLGALLLSLIPAAFLITRRHKGKAVTAVALVAVVLLSFFVFRKITEGDALYGVVISEHSFAPVYAIPDEKGSVKLEVETGDKVKIIDRKDVFYLIQTTGRESGWINKNNIVME